MRPYTRLTLERSKVPTHKGRWGAANVSTPDDNVPGERSLETLVNDPEALPSAYDRLDFKEGSMTIDEMVNTRSATLPSADDVGRVDEWVLPTDDTVIRVYAQFIGFSSSQYTRHSGHSIA